MNLRIFNLLLLIISIYISLVFCDWILKKIKYKNLDEASKIKLNVYRDSILKKEKAFKEGRTVVVESFLDGTEVTCGVYRRKNGVYALPLTEIASENEYFDYEAKYLGKSQEITPARVDDKIRAEVQKQAKYIYELLQLKSIARIDFMLVNGIPNVIEVNTTPGFSSASIVPQMIKCDGGNIHDFWQEIIEVELNL